MSEWMSKDEMKKRMRQALLDHDEETLRADRRRYDDDFLNPDNPDDTIPYNYYRLLCETLNELLTELPDDEYLAALDTAPLLHDGQFIQFGPADDRKLFEVVKHVINDWDPAGLLDDEGEREDEYDLETGRISRMLKEDEDIKDIGDIAWGVHDVLCECLGDICKQNSMFPEYLITAGKLMAAVQESGLNNFGHLVEKPYTIAELTVLEKKLAELIKTIAQMLADVETPQKLNEYLNTLYDRLKSEYDCLSNDDVNSLYEYCIREAEHYAWTKGEGAYDKKRLDERSRIRGELWKYKTERPRLNHEFPEDLWHIRYTWDRLSEKNKLTFGEIIHVELEELRKKAHVDS